MAVHVKMVTGGNGIDYTMEVDGPGDHVSINLPNNTRFKDRSDGLIYYKDANGIIESIFGRSKNIEYDISFNEVDLVIQKFLVDTTITTLATTNIDTLETDVNDGGFSGITLPGDLPLSYSAGDVVTWKIGYSSGKSLAVMNLKGYES